MNILSCFLCVVLGMGIDSLYHHALRASECKAYREGVEQGRYEEKIRGERSYERYTTPRPMPRTNTYTLPSIFGQRLRENGQATMLLNRNETNNGGV